MTVPLLQEMAMRDANQDSKNKTDHFEDIPKHEYIDQGIYVTVQRDNCITGAQRFHGLVCRFAYKGSTACM